MVITWLQVEIQGGSGIPVAIGGLGDVTIRNDSGFFVIITNGQSAGEPGATSVSVGVTLSTDIARTSGDDLVVQVARYEYDDTLPLPQPGTIAITIPDRTVLSNVNLTQLWGTSTAGKPTFSVDPSGVINTISLI